MILSRSLEKFFCLPVFFVFPWLHFRKRKKRRKTILLQDIENNNKPKDLIERFFKLQFKDCVDEWNICIEYKQKSNDISLSFTNTQSTNVFFKVYDNKSIDQLMHISPINAYHLIYDNLKNAKLTSNCCRIYYFSQSNNNDN